ncbi:MAG: OsmC family protein [Bacteroidota bacterium]
MEKHTYNVNVKWKEDRKGVMQSKELFNPETDNNNQIEVATPPEFPGGMKHIWSPEHLFTAAVNSCLMTTFLAIAGHSKLDFISFDCNSEGVLEKVEGKFMMSKVYLYPEVVITDENQKDRANRILEKSEKACLISNSVKTEVIMKPKVIVQN